MKNVIERFLGYVKYDTQSIPDAVTFPSTDKQLAFGHALADEAKQIGLFDVEMDQYGYVTATLPSNIDKQVPTIAFIAHMDTSDEVSGADVNPQQIINYDGKAILLNNENNIVLSPDDFPELLNYVGQDLITTDGTTLLGADDKAGIAEILTAMEFLVQHPEIKHGTIKIAFTPDEEVGTGVDFFDVAKFNADFAYTVDGSEVGEIEYENFNAAAAKVFISGRSVHPGSAKDKMINALLIAMEFHNMLPQQEAPAFTEDYEGFYHLENLEGSVEHSLMVYILRDHDKAKLQQKKERMEKVAAYLNEKYGREVIRLELKDQYNNMLEKIEPVKYIIDYAKQAMEEVGIKPITKPIRGGTDGAKLSYMGLPTPNLFTGGHNAHGKYEFIPVQSMQKATDVILKIIEIVSKK